MKLKSKKIIAREILFFFSGIGLIVIIWFILTFSNSYYENKVVNSLDKIKTYQKQIENSPKNYIKEFYDKANRYFVLNYKYKGEYFSIPKEQEKAFLIDEFGNKKNLILMPTFSKGYSYFHKDIFKEFGGHELFPKKGKKNDSTVVFDFVSLKEFRKFLTSDDYQNKLYSTFSNGSDSNVWTPPVDAILSNFDPKQPYNGTFSLGSINEFKSKMNIGLKYNLSIHEKNINLKNNIRQLKKTILESRNKILNFEELSNIIFYISLFIVILMYVLRPSIVLIKWALKEIKQNNN